MVMDPVTYTVVAFHRLKIQSPQTVCWQPSLYAHTKGVRNARHAPVKVWIAASFQKQLYRDREVFFTLLALTMLRGLHDGVLLWDVTKLLWQKMNGNMCGHADSAEYFYYRVFHLYICIRKCINWSLYIVHSLKTDQWLMDTLFVSPIITQSPHK